MAGNTLYINTDFHTSTLSSVDTAVSRLGGNNKFRTNLVFVDDVLPAKTVAVFLLNGSDNQNGIFVAQQTQILHNLCTVYSRYDTAALVGYTATADFCICLIALRRMKFPVFDICDTNRINVSIKANQSFTGSHISKNISHGIDLNLIELQLSHFFCNAVNVRLFIAAFAGVFYDFP